MRKTKARSARKEKKLGTEDRQREKVRLQAAAIRIPPLWLIRQRRSVPFTVSPTS